MADQASISTDILARYAADAAREVEGVRAIPGRRGVRISGKDTVRVELHVVVEWGASIPALGGDVQSACASTSGAWPTSSPRASTSSWTRSNDAHRGADGRDARDGAGGLPRVHLVADPQRPERRQAQVDPRDGGRVGCLGHRLLRRRRAAARLDAVRAGGSVPARAGAAGGAAEPRRGARHVRLPHRSVKPWVMQSLFLTAIGDARERGARALEAFAYRYPEGEPSFERFHVHRTIFPADFLADFGFVRCARTGASSSRGSSSAACSRSTRARARRCCTSCARRSCRRPRRSGPRRLGSDTADSRCAL